MTNYGKGVIKLFVKPYSFFSSQGFISNAWISCSHVNIEEIIYLQPSLKDLTPLNQPCKQNLHAQKLYKILMQLREWVGGRNREYRGKI